MWWWLVFMVLPPLLAYMVWRTPPPPTGDDLVTDLERVQSVFREQSLCFQPKDTVAYYRHTTNRDYRWLRWFVGHTVLTAPPPVGYHGLGTRQVMFIFAEMCVTGARRVLEIGCGRGYCTLLMASLAPNVQFDAIDLVEEHIQTAQSDARTARLRNTRFFVGDGTVDNHGGTYDLIFGVESLCYVRSVPQFLRQVWQSLRPGGRLITVDGFRSPTFPLCTVAQRTAMRIAEQAFCINAMHSKAHWKRSATLAGLHVLARVCMTCVIHALPPSDRDLTDEALPFWNMGCWLSRWAFRFPCILHRYMESSEGRHATGRNLCGVAMVAHAMRDRGAAEYGCLVIGKLYHKTKP